MAQSQNQMIELITDKKKLSCNSRSSETMYIDDLAEYNCVLLATNEMKFQISWVCIQLILYTQLAETHMGMKNVNTFWLSEIIYDLTLVLSSHVFLLGMLFHIQVFKSSSIKTAEQLYSLSILNRLNQQELPLQNDLLDKFIFCMMVCKKDDIQITHERQLITSSL
ncbi:hypothetical protein ACO22_07765 [Paracoccidioides brasiliensis]|uniref:Uncharacterized protein n=1 Tax=Paracoccidioides brasiliensis TaxID=121759 RepID=A0A1D2J3R7_PARBR|nr:hypothetical protein ACO22_07765 [Paracoccidioides brasiliensis]